MDKNISNVLTTFRKRRGLDRRDIATAAGVSYLTVTKWEHGYSLPTEDELLKIAESFSVSPEIFGVEKAPEIEPTPEQKVEEKPARRTSDRIELRIDPSAKPAPKVEIIYEPKAAPIPEVKPEPISEQKVEEKPAPVVEPTPVVEPAPVVESAPAAESAPAPTTVGDVPFSEYEKAYAEKKARYEKHIRSSSYKKAGVKIRRMLAYALDLIIASAVMIGLLVAAMVAVPKLAQTLPKRLDLLIIACGASAVFVSLVFAFRDFFFFGRSLGKRIMGLTVIDERTAEKSAVYQRVLRALITATPIIDFIFFIVRGKTVGDSVASTLVVSKRANKAPVPASESYDIPEKKKKNRTALTVLFILLVVAFIVVSAACAAFVYGKALDSEKKSERYEVAYSYLVKSDAFLKSDATESEIKLVSCFMEYSFDSDELVCAYSFLTNEDTYKVVLHLGANTEWYVCNICTSFY